MSGRILQKAAVFFSVAISLGAGGCRRERDILRTGELIDLTVKDRPLRVEVASDELSRKLGLMDRRSLPESSGMLFVYAQADALGFWMHRTHIPLSIAFLSDDGKILQIEDMKPHDETHTRSNMKVRYALEVNQGWFRRNGIGVGDSIVDFREKVAGRIRGS